MARELARYDFDRAHGIANPKGYLAEFYRQQIAELDELVTEAESGG